MEQQNLFKVRYLRNGQMRIWKTRLLSAEQTEATKVYFITLIEQADGLVEIADDTVKHTKRGRMVGTYDQGDILCSLWEAVLARHQEPWSPSQLYG